MKISVYEKWFINIQFLNFEVWGKLYCFFLCFYEALFIFLLFSSGFCVIFNKNVTGTEFSETPYYPLKIRFDFHIDIDIEAMIKKPRISNFCAFKVFRNSSMKFFIIKGVFRMQSNITDWVFFAKSAIAFCL